MSGKVQSGVNWLKMLHDCGVIISRNTCDRTTVNILSISLLGDDVSADSSKTYFPHPVTNKPFYILLDPPHMLKLVRNTLATYKVIFNGNNEAIRWDNLEKLIDIKEKEGVHLGTKITRRHV